jgi:hypothetical protein
LQFIHGTNSKTALQRETDNVDIGREVIHVFCVLPILFNIYGEELIKEALSEIGDFNIGERIFNKV